MTHKLVLYALVGGDLLAEIEITDEIRQKLVTFDSDDPQGVGCYELQVVPFIEPADRISANGVWKLPG